MDKNTAIELLQQYSSGIRQFHQVQLEQADLKEQFLSQVDLKQANLNRANLKNADLSDADLSKSSLINADLSKAHLSRINLVNANLTEADLSESILNRADLSGACLINARFTSAVAIEANFSNANLSGANLIAVDLSTANLAGAFYDKDTSFPADFDPVSKGMIGECNVKELIAQFDHLCQCSNKYLGGTMTAKYFHSSRPDFDWLNQFAINKSSQVSFQGNLADSISSQQLQWFQTWMDSFVKSCSQIIKDFPKRI